jgi:hypothetical protein
MVTETQIKTAWENVKKDGKKFGGLLCEYRDSVKAQGRKGHGFVQLLDKLAIPRSTAYYFMDLYEDKKTKKSKKTHEPLTKYQRVLALLKQLTPAQIQKIIAQAQALAAETAKGLKPADSNKPPTKADPKAFAAHA